MTEPEVGTTESDELHSLVARCQNPKSRALIKDVVQAYSAGAYRSATVSAWTTLVYDLLFKLAEIAEIDGQPDAVAIIKEFEDILTQHDPRKAWELETSLLTKAHENFEMVSKIEHDELMRLLEDRNRCAHPAAHNIGEPFEPRRELCLYHIKNVLTMVLIREPVQGLAALNRVWQKIKSDVFPIDVASAKASLEASPLKRARSSLVRSVFVGLTKDCLGEDRPVEERKRQYAALKALIEMYPTQANEILRDEFAKLVAAKVGERFDRLIVYVSLIPQAYDVLNEADKTDLRTYIDRLDVQTNQSSLVNALEIEELESAAQAKLAMLDSADLALLITTNIKQQPSLLNIAVHLFSNSDSWNESGQLGRKLILPFISDMSLQQIADVISAFSENSEISGCNFFMPNLYTTLLRQTDTLAHALKENWHTFYLHLAEISDRDSWKSLKEQLEKKFEFDPEEFFTAWEKAHTYSPSATEGSPSGDSEHS